ncbi:hypothetical protein FKM82_019064 [Ascaphus truei]
MDVRAHIHTDVRTHTHSFFSTLQAIQNSAARLISGNRKFNHITPQLVHRAINDTKPLYLQTKCKFHRSTSNLQFQNLKCIKVPKLKRTNQAGGAPSVQGTREWNAFPISIRNTKDHPHFRKRLRTWLFDIVFLNPD